MSRSKTVQLPRRPALDQVLATTRQALDELRRMLGLLRLRAEPELDATAPGAIDPMPGLDTLPELLARFRAAGLPVTLTRTGTPRPLPPGLALSVYRIVQESLTNALKHADATSAEVTLSYRPDGLCVAVEDDGRTPARPGEAVSGHGITGMRERATLYGGTLVAGPRTPHGYAVRLTVPLARPRVTAPSDDPAEPT